MTKKHVITYDVGTTGFKAGLFELSKEDGLKLIASHAVSYPLIILDNGGAEQDPNDWWNAMCTCNRVLLEKTGIKPSEISAISFCSQFCTMVLIDKDGNALRPAMSCMDTRAGKQYRDIFRSGMTLMGMNIAKLIKTMRLSGLPSTSVKDTVWRYNWVRENEPEVFAKIYKWLDAKEYLVYRATGKATCSYDDAYGTFLLNKKTNKWDKRLCDVYKINPEHLPEQCNSSDCIGTLTEKAAKELGLTTDTMVISGGNDISLCQVGSGAVLKGDVNICCGTSGWVTSVWDKFILDLKTEAATVIGPSTDMLLFFANDETAGKCVEWVKERMSATPLNTFDALNEMVLSSPPGARGVVFSPWMHGNRCPFEDENSRGAFFNIDVDTKSADLMRAVIEGVCMHFRWLYEVTCDNLKTTDTIRFVGGSAMSPIFCQILSDVLGKTIEVPEAPRYAGTAGAAALCAIRLGLLDSLSEVKGFVKVGATYSPNPENTAVYDKILPVFKNLYFDNKKSFKALNG